MINFDLYGVNGDSIFEARLNIESLLSIAFEEHDGLYESGLYFLIEMEDGTQIKLKLNRDPFEDEPAELDYPTYPYLLYIDDTEHPEVFRNALARSGGAVTLLRHKER